MDFASRSIWYSEGSTQRRKLYDIIGASCGAAEPPQRQVAPEPAYRQHGKRTEEPRYFSTRPKKVVKSTGCSSGKVRVDGRCIRRADVASFCGPGYRRKGSKCVPGAYQAPKAKDGLPSWQKEAISKGCPKGMGWNAQEGCHEND